VKPGVAGKYVITVGALPSSGGGYIRVYIDGSSRGGAYDSWGPGIAWMTLTIMLDLTASEEIAIYTSFPVSSSQWGQLLIYRLPFV
jgi:hypothetical protein